MEKVVDLHDVDVAYRLLEKYGISRNSSMEDVDKCTFEIMRRSGLESAGGMEELAAVRMLKQVADRLTIDFLASAEVPAEHSSEDAQDVVLAICDAAPEPRNVLDRLGLSPERLAKKSVDAEMSEFERLEQERYAELGLRYSFELNPERFVKEEL